MEVLRKVVGVVSIFWGGVSLVMSLGATLMPKTNDLGLSILILAILHILSGGWLFKHAKKPSSAWISASALGLCTTVILIFTRYENDIFKYYMVCYGFVALMLFCSIKIQKKKQE